MVGEEVEFTAIQFPNPSASVTYNSRFSFDFGFPSSLSVSQVSEPHHTALTWLCT